MMVNMGVESDMVTDILVRLQRKFPFLNDEQLRELEKDIRHHWGGEKPYIGKDIKRLKHERERIKNKLSLYHISVVAKEEGLSKRTLYRILREA